MRAISGACTGWDSTPGSWAPSARARSKVRGGAFQPCRGSRGPVAPSRPRTAGPLGRRQLVDAHDLWPALLRGSERPSRAWLRGGRRGWCASARLVGVIVTLHLPGAVVVDQSVDVAISGLFGGPVLERGAPRFKIRGHGGVAVHDNRPPFDVDQLDVGYAVVDEVLIIGHLLLVEVRRSSGGHHARIARLNGLHLRLVYLSDDLLDCLLRGSIGGSSGCLNRRLRGCRGNGGRRGGG